MKKRLDNKTALVIGAGSRGPGWGNDKASSVLFSREGARVVCVDINAEAAAETAELIRKEGGHAIALQADASNSSDVPNLVGKTIEAFGNVDVLYNNVGVAAPGSVVDVSEEDWDRVFAINVRSFFLTMKHVIPLMIANGGGSIVNMSSSAALRHTGTAYATYYATKAAVSHLTRTTAVDFADQGIRVNAVVPGYIMTPMVETVDGQRRPPEQLKSLRAARSAQIPSGPARRRLGCCRSGLVSGIGCCTLRHRDGTCCGRRAYFKNVSLGATVGNWCLTRRVA
ncbi:SDR family NAD(P)-dependent oxidoreductase [Cupriavidus sp. BIC8F]|uniref:SDR family NAD(P)-dependent oxidoreductase n=1 Tax=Cupriavidus sp. BIC8F TaxID=3079014 RepID=UPI003CCE1CA5